MMNDHALVAEINQNHSKHELTLHNMGLETYLELRDQLPKSKIKMKHNQPHKVTTNTPLPQLKAKLREIGLKTKQNEVYQPLRIFIDQVHE